MISESTVKLQCDWSKLGFFLSLENHTKMSMLNKLKQTQKNPVFLDENEDMDVDNMDFPLPTESSSSAPAGMPNFAELQKMMQNMSTGAAPTPAPESDHIAVATGPQGVRRLSPEEYKE